MSATSSIRAPVIVVTRRLVTVLCTLAAGGVTLCAQNAQPRTNPAPAQPPLGSRPPASSLARPSTTSKATGPAGFLQRWLLLEPIRVNGQLSDSAVQAAVNTDYFPNQLSVLPSDGDKVKVAAAELVWHAVDTLGYNVNLYHFAYALNKPTSNVLFWAVTIVDALQEMSNVRLAIGSNAASAWWVNGQPVINLYNDRQSVIDDGVSRRVTLKKGANVVRAAIINAGGATDFCARFLDADGRPVKGLSVNLSSK